MSSKTHVDSHVGASAKQRSQATGKELVFVVLQEIVEFKF